MQPEPVLLMSLKVKWSFYSALANHNTNDASNTWTNVSAWSVVSAEAISHCFCAGCTSGRLLAATTQRRGKHGQQRSQQYYWERGYSKLLRRNKLNRFEKKLNNILQNKNIIMVTTYLPFNIKLLSSHSSQRVFIFDRNSYKWVQQTDTHFSKLICLNN